MIDKTLIKKRFSKSFSTYDDNAIVQKRMAEKLVDFLPKKEFNSVLEIGCATGLLTKQAVLKLSFNNFALNDIVEDAENYARKIVPNSKFFLGDVEKINFDEKYDLIISNACLQWCSDIERTILKLSECLNVGGTLAVSVFGKDNLKEINEIFNLQLKTVDVSKLPDNAKIFEEQTTLFFDSPIEVLKHLKLTGVNAVKETRLTKSKLKEFEQKYLEKFAQKNRVQLTYNPVYIIISC